MNILGCLDTPTSGEYLFQGVEVGGLTRNQRALLRRHYLGFVFQGYNLLKRTSALENVELPLIYRGHAGARAAFAGAAGAEAVGLAGWEGHTPGELSGGQQQRVAIARAIVSQPVVLLADEPTGNLDSARSVEIMELLRALNSEEGITVVMVTHEPDMAAYAKRIVHFGRDGIDRERDAAKAQQRREEIVAMMGNALLLALRELRRNVMRSILTMLGIIIGVAAVIILVTLGSGATAESDGADRQFGEQPADGHVPASGCGPGAELGGGPVQAGGCRGHRAGCAALAARGAQRQSSPPRPFTPTRTGPRR